MQPTPNRTAKPYHYTPVDAYHSPDLQLQQQHHPSGNHNHSSSSSLFLPRQPTAYPRSKMSSNHKPFRLLLFVLPLLMVVSIIELSFVSAMVGFLHGRANGFFIVDSPGTSSNSGPDTFELKAKPWKLLEDQGHTSNGAAGTGFVLIGLGGLLLIWWERRRLHLTSARSQPSGLFTTYFVLTILSTLLALAALIYTFVLTSKHANQTIDLQLASENPSPMPYPGPQQWTPENWFKAVLEQVPLQLEGDKDKLRSELMIMRGWRYNLIPLFLVDLLVAGVAGWEWWGLRRGGGMGMGMGRGDGKEGL